MAAAFKFIRVFGSISHSSSIYPGTSCFLLQHTELDVTDVTMMYGNSDDWKNNREDWKHRHTWELLASLVQSSTRDECCGRRCWRFVVCVLLSSLVLFANLTCIAQATTSLMLKWSLLSWIELQVQLPQSIEDGLVWLKIPENIPSHSQRVETGACHKRKVTDIAVNVYAI